MKTDKRQVKKKLLHEAALKVFAKYGYRRARIEDIADELGLRKASLYNYIESKKELYQETIVQALFDWQSTAKEAADKYDDPAEQLYVYAIKGVSYLLKHDDLRKIITEDPSIFPVAKKKDRFSMLNQASVDIVEGILQRGIEKGVFCQMNAKQAAEMLYSVYIFYIIKIYVDSNFKPSLKAFKDVVPIIFNGLLKR